MRVFFIILLLQILAGSEIDLFVPSFPEIEHAFGLTPFLVELTLGLNLAAHCITCLVAGNLGDRFGRKPIIIAGLILFSIGSLLCCYAPEYWVLLLGRVLQGIGIAGPSTLSYVIIADSYSAQKQTQLMGALNGSLTLAMAFAPVLGSYISLLFHWRGNFFALLFLGLICLALSIVWIPKSVRNHSVSLSFKEYLPLIRSSRVIDFVGAPIFLISSYWLFIGLAPILYMEALGITLKEFGFYQGTLAAVFCIMSFASGPLLKRFGEKKCFQFGMATLVLFIAGILILTLGQVKSPAWITVVMAISSIGAVFPINILYPRMLEAVPNAKGRLSAIAMSSRLLTTALSIQIASYFYDGSFAVIGWGSCIMYGLTFWYTYRLFYKHKITLFGVK